MACFFGPPCRRTFSVPFPLYCINNQHNFKGRGQNHHASRHDKTSDLPLQAWPYRWIMLLAPRSCSNFISDMDATAFLTRYGSSTLQRQWWLNIMQFWNKFLAFVFGKKYVLNLRRWQGRSFSVLHRVSVLVQRYNAVLLHDTLPAPDFTVWWPVPNFVLS